MTATPSDPTVVTLIPGDGIGPECVDAARRIIEAAGAQIAWEECEAGAEVFKKGLPSGVPPETIDSISRTRVALKGPLETPVGFGEKSANVTLRKLFETYANVRPVREMPGVTTPYSGRGIDLVVVRENVEDLYAGIEYMQTPGVAQALKLISEKGCGEDRAVRVRVRPERGPHEGRMRDQGQHHEVLRGHAEARVRTRRARLSRDRVLARDRRQRRASAGQAPRAVRRDRHHEHERRHPVRPVVGADRRARVRALGQHRQRGRDLRGGARLGAEVRRQERDQPDRGDPVVGADAALPRASSSRRRRSSTRCSSRSSRGCSRATCSATTAGRRPPTTRTRSSATSASAPRPGRSARSSRSSCPKIDPRPDYVRPASRSVVGLDVFVESPLSAAELGSSLMELTHDTKLSLKMISSRGTKVFPPTGAMTETGDHFRCRFIIKEEPGDLSDEDVHELLVRISSAHRGCTSRSCRSSTASSGSPATRARTSPAASAADGPRRLPAPRVARFGEGRLLHFRPARGRRSHRLVA